LIVRDINRAATKVAKIVIGIYAKNLPIIPGSVSSGINTHMVVAVPDIRGVLYSLTANKIEFLGLNPCFIFSCAHSMTTIVVSIAIQNVIIKLKLVRKFKLNHRFFNTTNVIKKASGKVIVAISDSLNQTNISNATNTNSKVCNPFFAKVL
jgi:hypothetical protein